MRSLAVVALTLTTLACSPVDLDTSQLHKQVDGHARRLDEIPSHFYEPGMGDLMHALQLRHAKLWFAGSEENWPLAEFELHEIRENLDRIARWQPQIEEVDAPTSVALKAWIGASVSQLDTAIQQRSREQFVHAFDRFSTGCNACHTAAKHEFIIIQRPRTPPLDNQRYSNR